MTWNFCPWCSHRIYQHDGTGCTFLYHDLYVPCKNPQCEDRSPGHGHVVDKQCDCKRPHQLMTEGIGG